MGKEDPVKEGKFYFWRNLFMSVIVSIFVCIGAAVAFSWSMFQTAESKVRHNEKCIAVMETEVSHFRVEQRELKQDIKDDFKEVKDLIRNGRNSN